VSDLRLLTINDGYAIERYVVHLTQWRELQYLISSESSGSFRNAMRDPDVRKLVLIVQTESRRLHKLLQDFEAAFGLTPAARARLVTEKQQQENPIATLLARRGEN
jgi:phage terminase small subunit